MFNAASSQIIIYCEKKLNHPCVVLKLTLSPSFSLTLLLCILDFISLVCLLYMLCNATASDSDD